MCVCVCIKPFLILVSRDISENSALQVQSWKFLLKMKNLKEL